MSQETFSCSLGCGFSSTRPNAFYELYKDEDLVLVCYDCSDIAINNGWLLSSEANSKIKLPPANRKPLAPYFGFKDSENHLALFDLMDSSLPTQENSPIDKQDVEYVFDYRHLAIFDLIARPHDEITVLPADVIWDALNDIDPNYPEIIMDPESLNKQTDFFNFLGEAETLSSEQHGKIIQEDIDYVDKAQGSILEFLEETTNLSNVRHAVGSLMKQSRLARKNKSN